MTTIMNTSPDGLKVNQTLGASRDKAHNPMSRSRLLFQSSDTAPATPLQLANSDGLLSSLKRKLSDSTVDYPRRRATIAVSKQSLCTSARFLYHKCLLRMWISIAGSVKSAGLESLAATAVNQNANYAPNWAPSAFIASLVSSWTLVTS